MHKVKQEGITLIGLIIVLSIIGFLTLTTLKLFPVYMENLAVQKAMEAVETEPTLKSLTAGQMRSLFEKKLNVNQVTSVQAKDAKINRSVGEVTFKVEYEVRKDYIANIDLVMSFNHEFVAPI